eukprot:TRINITY_DN1132_c0_g1_i1.p5 TRINITY_DN1132_c0_g1~~TRINITY_DN1132_c0_g1_i1.p5  ORF type:complete len:108 (+),score=35.64 TRINITY_DN1132_c0_g1_i1:94-417(+)
MALRLLRVALAAIALCASHLADAGVAKTNPLFSEDACSTMYATKKKLGGALAPTDIVVGCDDVCEQARHVKEYWKSGDAADAACKHMAAYGCVFDGTPPKTAADIGC